MTSIPKWERRWSPPPFFSFDYKNVALIVLRAALPCLTACISRKHPMLIYSFFVHCLVSLWILSVMRQKNPSFSRSWHQVSSFNEKVVGSSLFLSSSLWDQAPVWVWLGLSLSPWVQAPIWVLAECESHLRRSAVSVVHPKRNFNEPRFLNHPIHRIYTKIINRFLSLWLAVNFYLVWTMLHIVPGKNHIYTYICICTHTHTHTHTYWLLLLYLQSSPLRVTERLSSGLKSSVRSWIKLNSQLSCVFFFNTFGDHEGTQNRLLSFAWTLWVSRALVPARASCVCPSSWQVQTGRFLLGLKFLVLNDYPEIYSVVINSSLQEIDFLELKLKKKRRGIWIPQLKDTGKVLTGWLGKVWPGIFPWIGYINNLSE